MGPLKKLPRDYTGEKHLEVVERCPCPEQHYCRFEERPGPAPANAADFVHDRKSNIRLIDIHLVPSPTDTKPERQRWAELTSRCRAAGIAR